MPTTFLIVPHVLQPPLQVRPWRLNLVRKMWASVLTAMPGCSEVNVCAVPQALSAPSCWNQKLEVAWIPESQRGGHLSEKGPQTLSGLCLGEKYKFLVLND